MSAPLPPEQHATIDFETYSEAGLFWDGKRYVSMHRSNKQSDKGLSGVGSAVYAEHPSTEVLTLSYRLPGQPIRRWRPGLPLPQDLFDWAGPIEAHNVMFERSIWEQVCTPRYGFPPVDPARWRCSMAKARVVGLPGALGNLTKVLNTAVVKDADGKRLLDKFSVPRKPTKTDPRFRIRPEEDPEDAERLYRYCDVDVESEELASAAMPDMTPDELAFWQIDQEINHRGVGVDLDSVRNMRVVLEQTLEHYGREFAEITGGLSPSQVQATVGWLAARGVPIQSLDADAVEAALKLPDLPTDARRVLELRARTGSASVKKLYSLERMATKDRRLKNLLVHHGARTGRACIAAGQGVLVKMPSGEEKEIPIEQVALDDMLWDGSEWVHHRGVVPAGIKEVIEYDGVVATPDHRVYTSASEYTSLSDARAAGAKILRGGSNVSHLSDSRADG